jgi:cellulose synthase A
MEASAGLVAGSHNRNELVLIRGHEDPKPVRALSGQVCEICGDEVGLTVDGDLFRRLQRVRLPGVPPLLRVRAPGGHAELPSVQDTLQATQGYPFYKKIHFSTNLMISHACAD